MKRSGFTLIEMLVVVAIITVLAGFVFRMVAAMGNRNDVAETRAILEKTAHALEEFRSIYGKYPNVPFYPTGPSGRMQPTYFEYPSNIEGNLSDAEQRQIRDSTTGDATGRWIENPGSTKHAGILFTMGLASYFLPRVAVCRGSASELISKKTNGKIETSHVMQWHDYNRARDRDQSTALRDSDRDLNSVRRILPHLDGYLNADGTVGDSGIIYPYDVFVRSVTYSATGNRTITNRTYRIRDAWYRDIYYDSLPPYDSYRLWSAGPDGKTTYHAESESGGNATKKAQLIKKYCSDDIYAGEY